jgi:hypothetical protein
MTIEQLTIAVQELQRDCAVYRERIDEQDLRIAELERQAPDPLWAEKAEATDRIDWLA